MLPLDCLRELNQSWLPNITNAGLDRLIEMLEQDSPLLIHGSFTQVVPQGCLATHIAWNHPRTAHLTQDAGLAWLNHVAELNPATSLVIREWDRWTWETRAELLAIFKDHRRSRLPLALKRAALPQPQAVESI